jgi:hypothetical protein
MAELVLSTKAWLYSIWQGVFGLLTEVYTDYTVQCIWQGVFGLLTELYTDYTVYDRVCLVCWLSYTLIIQYMTGCVWFVDWVIHWLYSIWQGVFGLLTELYTDYRYTVYDRVHSVCWLRYTLIIQYVTGCVRFVDWGIHWLYSMWQGVFGCVRFVEWSIQMTVTHSLPLSLYTYLIPVTGSDF